MPEAPSQDRSPPTGARNGARSAFVEWAGRFGLVLFGVLSTLLLVEVGIRVGLDIYRCDEQLGWGFSPGKVGLRVSRRGAFANVVRINSLGFHDLERSTAKPEGTQRIVFLGDSFVAATQVPVTSIFTSDLQERLSQDASDQSFEVINAGIDGYGTAQEFLLYRERIADLDPDVVFVSMFLHNDVFDNSIVFGDAYHALAHRCGRPYFVTEGGDLSLSRGPVPGTRGDGVLWRWLGKSDLFGVLFPFAGADRSARALHQYDVYEPEASPAIEASWSVTEHLLLQLDLEVRSSGRRLAVLIVPSVLQVHPRGEARFPEGVDAGRPTARLLAFLEEAAIPHVDLTGPLRSRIWSGGNPYLQGDPHWSEEGHGLVSAVIHQWLRRNCELVGLPIGRCDEA